MKKMMLLFAILLPLSVSAQRQVSWETLGKVESKWQNNKYVTQFKPEVWALNRQSIKIQGFMLPLEMGDKQQHFMLAARPAHCYFDAPGGKEMIEVYLGAQTDYEFTPITITGQLEVLQNDQYGMYYRIRNARVTG
jgi:hypothetical protein